MDYNNDIGQTSVLSQQAGAQPNRSKPVLTREMYEQMVFTEPKPEPPQKPDVPVWLMGSLIGVYVILAVIVITVGVMIIQSFDYKDKVTTVEQQLSDLQEEIHLMTDDIDQAEQSISSMADTIDSMTATELVTEEITEEVTEEPATEAPAPVLSSDLNSNEIQIDGVIYTIPFANQSIAPYYSFDMTKYGFENGYVVNPGDSVINTMELSREGMNENFHFRIGLHNYSDQILDIQECNVNVIELDAAACESFEGCPQVVLPGNITWGSAVDQIIAAYGEPTENVAMEDGSSILHYDTETPYIIRELRVSGNRGLISITIKML